MRCSKIKIVYSLVLLLIFSCGPASAQLFKRVDGLTKKADEFFYEKQDYPTAVQIYREVLNRERENNEVKLKLAECYRLMEQPEQAERWYRTIIDNSEFMSQQEPIYHYFFALVLESNGKYDEAHDWFEIYQKEMPEDRRVLAKLESISNLSKHYQDSSNYEVSRLLLNSAAEDFGLAYFGNGLIFTSDRKLPATFVSPIYSADSIYLSRFYYTERMPDGTYLESELFAGSLNEGFHEGTASFYNDFRSMAFTRTSRQGINARTYKLWFAEKSETSENWTQLREYSFNSGNESFSIIHPYITNDGKTLFFASDMPGGLGGYDIYMSQLDDTGNWTRPVNLGERVNTQESEYFPYIFNNGILFFTSRGHGGLGGMDIYRINLLNEEAKVENLGFPVNTNKNDYGFVVDPQGFSGYFSSDREGGSGGSDIYRFERKIYIRGQVTNTVSGEPVNGADVLLVNSRNNLAVGAETGEDGRYSVKLEPNTTYKLKVHKNGYETGEPGRVSTYGLEDKRENNFSLQPSNLICKGVVTDKVTGQPLFGARVLLVNNKTNQVHTIVTDHLGRYIFWLQPENWYTVQVERKGYFIKKVDLNGYEKSSGDFVYNFGLEEVKFNEFVALKRTGYSSDKADLGPLNEQELNELALFLKANPEVGAEMMVYTDSRGSQEENRKTAENRARFLELRMQKQGVPEGQIKVVGVGEDNLLNECKDGVFCTEKMHSENRRIELKLVSDGEINFSSNAGN